MLALGIGASFISSIHTSPPGHAQGSGTSLRFYGFGDNDVDRVKIGIDNPHRPVDVSGNFTLEFWMKADAGDNTGSQNVNCNQESGWIYGNIVFDRDVFGGGDYGDYGIALRRSGTNRYIAFGVTVASSGTTLCGATNVANGNWHHVAVTRNGSTGQIRIFVDGALDAQGTGPTGDISYRDGRSTSYPNSDPFLVIGAEKHDAGGSFPSYSGFVDEVRISNILRYTSNFTPPSGPFTTDGNTMALYHLDGTPGNCTGTVTDSSGASGGPSNGICNFGGSPSPGPVYSSDTPFNGGPTNTPTSTATPTPTHTPTPTLAILGTPDAAPLASLGVANWQTNILSDSRVRFLQGLACSEGDPWLKVITLTTQVMLHSVVLTDLSPSTDYCYQVQSSNVISTTAWTAGQSFTTLASQFDSYLPLISKDWVAP